MCFPVESVVKHGEKTLRPKNVILKRLTQVSKLYFHCNNLMAVNIGIHVLYTHQFYFLSDCITIPEVAATAAEQVPFSQRHLFILFLILLLISPKLADYKANFIASPV